MQLLPSFCIDKNTSSLSYKNETKYIDQTSKSKVFEGEKMQFLWEEAASADGDWRRVPDDVDT